MNCSDVGKTSYTVQAHDLDGHCKRRRLCSVQEFQSARDSRCEKNWTVFSASHDKFGQQDRRILTTLEAVNAVRSSMRCVRTRSMRTPTYHVCVGSGVRKQLTALWDRVRACELTERAVKVPTSPYEWIPNKIATTC
jgi:hypothetical protein